MNTEGSVPVAVAARVYGKDPSWIRAGLIFGWLPIGFATYRGQRIDHWPEQGRANYYISPVKLYKATGYMWKGERS